MSIASAGRMPISPWPFVIAFPGELMFALMRLNQGAQAASDRTNADGIVIITWGLTVSLLAVWAIRRYFPPPGSLARWAGEYILVTLLGFLAMTGYAVIVDPSRIAGPATMAGVLVVRIVNVLFFAAIVDGIVRQWRLAVTTGQQLSSTLTRVSRVNSLLLEATEHLYVAQADFIHNRILPPLQQLLAAAPESSDEQLADRVDALVADTMRPLAHEMHPVTLSVGLASALTTLGTRFIVTVDPIVAALDSVGGLLDVDVRLQVYRWIRAQAESAGSPVGVTLEIVERSLVITMSGDVADAAIDPMMAVAGIRSVPTQAANQVVAVAPLRGQFVDQVIAGEALLALEPEPAPDNRTSHRHGGAADEAGRATWVDALTTARSQRILWTAIVALVALPSQVTLTGLNELGLSAVLALGYFILPVAVSGLLGLVPVRQGSRVSALWVVVSWVIVGIVAGLADSFASEIVNVLRGATAELPPVGFDLVRGLMRFTLVGLLVTAARGLLYRSRANSERLGVEVTSALDERARILAESDRMERYLAEKLHRSVQGRLSAVSLLLRLGRRPEALAELDILCRTTVPAISTHMAWFGGAGDFHLLDGADAPPGLEVVESVDPAVVSALGPEAIDRLRSFAAECAVNAHRHGQATRMEVSLHGEGSQAVLTCSNTGRALAPDASAGLGSALFDEVVTELAGTWCFVPSSGRVIVQAVIPIGTSAGSPASQDQSVLTERAAYGASA